MLTNQKLTCLLVLGRSNLRVAEAGDKSEGAALHCQLELGVVVEDIVSCQLVEMGEKTEPVVGLTIMLTNKNTAFKQLTNQHSPVYDAACRRISPVECEEFPKLVG